MPRPSSWPHFLRYARPWASTCPPCRPPSPSRWMTRPRNHHLLLLLSLLIFLLLQKILNLPCLPKAQLISYWYRDMYCVSKDCYRTTVCSRSFVHKYIGLYTMERGQDLWTYSTPGSLHVSCHCSSYISPFLAIPMLIPFKGS